MTLFWTPPQLAPRRPVWLALAELFLDSDCRPDLPALALVLAESAYSESELVTIWQGEVAPLLHANLHSVAGVWGAWDEAWLSAELERRGPAVGRLVAAVHRIRVGGVATYFQTLLTLRRELLELSKEDRARRVRLQCWLGRRYFRPEPSGLASSGLATRPDDPELSAVFMALEPKLRPLLNRQEAAADPRRHVLTLMGGPA